MQVEKIEYKKAYVELYEIIKALPEEEQEKIPKTLLKNLKDNMSKEYKFEIDTERDILNQNYKIETKALFVELYERYLAPKEEKNFWDKYDKICNNILLLQNINLIAQNINKSQKECIKKINKIQKRQKKLGNYLIHSKYLSQCIYCGEKYLYLNTNKLYEYLLKNKKKEAIKKKQI